MDDHKETRDISKEEFRGTNFNVDFYKDFLTPEESSSVFKILEKQVKWSNLITPGNLTVVINIILSTNISI